MDNLKGIGFGQKIEGPAKRSFVFKKSVKKAEGPEFENDTVSIKFKQEQKEVKKEMQGPAEKADAKPAAEKKPPVARKNHNPIALLDEGYIPGADLLKSSGSKPNAHPEPGKLTFDELVEKSIARNTDSKTGVINSRAVFTELFD